MSDSLFWPGLWPIARVGVMGLLSYVYLVVLLRVTGKRTLSKLNAFDLIVTVALGSTFSAVILDKSITLAEGCAAFTVLVVMQLAVTWASVRNERFEQLVKARPTIVAWRGELLHQPMREVRVTEAEILAACREAGASRLDDVEAVVLETDGAFSIMMLERGARQGSVPTILRTTSNYPPPTGRGGPARG